VTVGLLILDCFISESLSLKDKRRILTSLSERLRRSFNVALCEVDFQDQWQRARLAAVLVNTDWRMLQSTMSKMVEFIDRDRRLQVLDTETRRLV
jgi:hypothetical protein